MKNPEFIVFTGPMFGSKTTRLLAAIDRYKIQQKDVMVFKPKMDTRYSVGRITTHNGGSIEAHVIDKGSQLTDLVLSRSSCLPDVIAVDEAFMIDSLAESLSGLYKLGITILVSSLDLSATCSPFEEIAKLLPFATRVEKCPAVCTLCGDDAYYTHKKFENDKK